jgi:hypothetical protein
VAGHELRGAPWREALAGLALPLSAALLLLWTYGFVPRYDHWPLGEGWVMLLGGSLAAVVGAALRMRALVVLGALAVLAAAAPYLGLGTEAELKGTPTFYQGYDLDLGAASLLPTLLLAAAGAALPLRRPAPARQSIVRLGYGLLPALIALANLLPPPSPKSQPITVFDAMSGSSKVVTTPPYPFPEIVPSRTLVAVLATALLIALVIAAVRVRSQPAAALGTGLVIASVAYPVAWVAIRHMPSPYWLYNGVFPLLVSLLPLLAALILVGRGSGERAKRGGVGGARPQNLHRTRLAPRAAT